MDGHRQIKLFSDYPNKMQLKWKVQLDKLKIEPLTHYISLFLTPYNYLDILDSNIRL